MSQQIDETAETVDYCPHCYARNMLSRHEESDTVICDICYTTPSGETKAQIDTIDDEESVDFDKPPHEQSVRPRYSGAVEHGEDLQVVMYGAFGYDPPLAPLENILNN